MGKSLRRQKRKIAERVRRENVVFKRFSGERTLLQRKFIGLDYGPTHKSVEQQLIESGWTPTHENPLDYVSIRCWWGTEGTGARKRPVIKHAIAHHTHPKGWEVAA